MMPHEHASKASVSTENINLPNSPLGVQLRWLVARLFPAQADEAEVEEHFSPVFLAHASASQLLSLSVEIFGRFDRITIIDATSTSRITAAVTVSGAYGIKTLVRMAVEPDPPHRLSGLQLSRVEDTEQGDETSADLQVIVLNGVSSAGKSSIAKALQVQLRPQVWLHVEIDAFLRMVPPPPAIGAASMKRIIEGAHGAMPALVAAGNRIIIDHVLAEPDWWPDLARRLGDTRLLFVGVHCDEEVLEARERARGDRMIGTARAQVASTHVGKTYDLEVDTSSTSPEKCVAAILSKIAVHKLT